MYLLFSRSNMKKTRESFKFIVVLLVALGAMSVACALTATPIGPLTGAGGGSNQEGDPPAATEEPQPIFTEEPAGVPTEEIVAPPAFGRIVFVSNRDGKRKIYSMPADGGEPTRLTNGDSEDDMPHWSSDGSQIVFVSMLDDNSDIYTMNSNGGNVTRLTNSPAKDSAPAWSPCHD